MFKNNFILLVLLLGALCGCVDRSINEGVMDRGPQVFAAPLPASERMAIAIARFTNESI